MKYVFYFIDTETTGLDSRKNDIIELSLCRSTDCAVLTKCLKPINKDAIETSALRVNGHKLEDLLHQTKYGIDTYQEPEKILIEIENWVMEDGVFSTERVLVGHNIFFDKDMLEHLWIKCNSKDTFPFGRRILDTMSIELFMNFAENSYLEGYSLANLAKKYNVKNAKAHTAEADMLTMKEVFEKQVLAFCKNK